VARRWTVSKAKKVKKDKPNYWDVNLASGALKQIRCILTAEVMELERLKAASFISCSIKEYDKNIAKINAMIRDINRIVQPSFNE
jgi:hypothetical protein